MSTRPITIVGGGLAGLTLGIGLRQQNVPATIHEAGHYPRHRVCGEFISGRGQKILEQLGLRGLLESSGAVIASTTAFYSATRSGKSWLLPVPALCISRYVLDAALASRFRELGGELIENSRFSGDYVEGFVRATGRCPVSGEHGSRCIGLKIHAHNVALAADLEMHASPQGYVGLCRTTGGRVNVCGLFQNRTADSKPGRAWLHGPPGSLLSRRLANADFDDDSFCAVAGLSLEPQPAAGRSEICIGDTITMIPPVTGNGMSMAFESAALTIAPLVAFSRGEISWLAAKEKIARDCDAAFAGRLSWAKWLQRLMFIPVLQTPFVQLTGCSRTFQRLAFAHTR